jgi:hypothetical protein
MRNKVAKVVLTAGLVGGSLLVGPGAANAEAATESPSAVPAQCFQLVGHGFDWATFHNGCSVTTIQIKVNWGPAASDSACQHIRPGTDRTVRSSNPLAQYWGYYTC